MCFKWENCVIFSGAPPNTHPDCAKNDQNNQGIEHSLPRTWFLEHIICGCRRRQKQQCRMKTSVQLRDIGTSEGLESHISKTIAAGRKETRAWYVLEHYHGAPDWEHFLKNFSQLEWLTKIPSPRMGRVINKNFCRKISNCWHFCLQFYLKVLLAKSKSNVFSTGC